MSITHSLIVVIESQPQQGNTVYFEKDQTEYKERLSELGMPGRDIDLGDNYRDVELGHNYYNGGTRITATGYEVLLPYSVQNLCNDHFKAGEGSADHEVGDHILINFVAEAACETCRNG
jgi:hypothetical protein